VGAEWNPENPYAGYRYAPKLILAGRLTGTLDGRPVVIEAGAQGLLVSFPAFRTAWAARRTAGSLVPALQLLKRFEIPLKFRVGELVTIELLPRPSGVVRFFAPALARLA
jgi:hypothetical protein